MSKLHEAFADVKDGIVGRPIKCNRQILKITKQNYAEVMFIGDTHLGSPQFDQPRFQKMIDFCLRRKIYVFLMGDLIEMATRYSIGSGVYEQAYPGQTQYEKMVEILMPLAEARLLLGLLQGNHEERSYKAIGINVAKAMARELKCPYLGDACWNTFKVGKQSYSIYSLHGRSGARFDGTALLALERLSASFFADLVVMGHMHKLIESTVLMQRIHRGKVVEHKKHLLITGSYLKYDGGYAQTMGLSPSKLGSPKAKFFADEHDIHITW